MRLVEVHVDGFAKLVNRTFEFSPGFNLVFGPNEAGKSTLQRAILTMLYGFFSEGRRIKMDERALWKDLRPWDEQHPYQGSLIYTLDQNQSFQVSRTFAPELTTTLTTYPDQLDVSKRFKWADEGRLFFADEQLGMAKDVFESVCTVRQAELVALDTSAAIITETLMRLSATASADTKAGDAIILLEKMLEEEIGIVNAPTRPLAKARKHLARLEKERSQVLHIRRQIFSQIVDLNRLEEQLEQLDLKRQELRYLQSLAESIQIHRQLMAVEGASQEVSRWTEKLAQWEAWDDFPIELRDDVLRLSSQRSHLQEECAAAKARVEATQDQVEPLNEMIMTLEVAVANLNDVRAFPVDHVEQIQALAHEWKMAAKAKAAAEERLQKVQSDFNQARQSFTQEQEVLQPAVSLGHTRLADYRQRLLKAQEELRQATTELEQAEAAWQQVGLSQAQFTQLEALTGAVLAGAPLLAEQKELAQTDHELLTQLRALGQSQDRLLMLNRKRQQLRYLQALTESSAIREQLASTDKTAAAVAHSAEEVAKWQDWSSFPIDLHQDVIRLSAQRERLREECAQIRPSAAVAQEKLPSLQQGIAAVEKYLDSLASTMTDSSVSVEALPALTQLAQEWEVATERQQAAEARWQEAASNLQRAEQNLAHEQALLDPIIKLNPMGLAGLRHLLRHARDRVEHDTESLSQTEKEWAEAGMDEAKFEEMERAAQWIQSGAESDSERTRHLRNLPLFRRFSYSRKELVIYGWLKTAYTNLVRSRSEASDAQKALEALEAEIRSQLGGLVADGTLNDHTFEQLGVRLAEYQRMAGEVEQQKIFVAKLERELTDTRQKSYQIQEAVHTKLAGLGVPVNHLRTDLDRYIEQATQKQRMQGEEDKLERLRLQAQTLQRDVNNLQEREAFLQEVAAQLQTTLAQAGIERPLAELDAGVEQFNENVEKFKRWSEAKSVYQGVLKHDISTDDDSRARLEASLVKLSADLEMMRSETPTLAELAPDKTFIEYVTLNRENDETLLAERDKNTALKETIQRELEAVKQSHTTLTAAQNKADTAHQTLKRLERDINEQLGALTGEKLDESAFSQLEQRLENYLRTAADVERKEVSVAELQTELNTATLEYGKTEGALQARLGAAGFDTIPLQTAFDTYTRHYERRKELEQKEAELEQLRHQLEKFAHDQKTWQDHQNSLQRVEEKLSQLLLIQAGIDSSPATLDEGLAKFEQGVTNHKEWQAARHAYEAAVERQNALPDVRACLALKTSLAELEANIDAARQSHSGWLRLRAEESPLAYMEQIGLLDTERAETHREFIDLKNHIDQTINNLRHPAEVDEEIHEAKADIHRLEQFRDALRLGHDELARATQEFQKLFAPRLELLMNESLGQISHGRYSQVRVEPETLTVMLVAPEFGNTVSVERLSTGTRDLVYLTLRVGLTQLMSRTGEKLPLLLDDPLVQFDRGRQEEALEFLNILAEKTQVILFTKDEWMKTWFQENPKTKTPLHTLHILERA